MIKTMYTQIPLKQGKEFHVGLIESHKINRPRYYADRILPWKKPNLPEARKEAAEKLVREKTLQGVMFNDVVKRSKTIIYETRTVWPFDIFPNDLIIDLTKVTLVTRSFFFSGQTQSVYIKDIMDVIVETGPFFSTLRVVDSGFVQNKLAVKYLTRKSAARARQVIEGLISASKAGVDMTKIGRAEVLERLPEITKAQKTPTP